jgi:hypothetical protein
MKNEYDDILSSEVAGKQSEYDALLQVEKDVARTKLRQSVLGAVQSNPDQYAQAKRLSQATGVPAPVVERNLPDIQKRAQLNEYDALLDTSPKLANRMQDPDFAKLAHDDTKSLAELERQFGSLKPSQGPEASFSSVVRGLFKSLPQGAEMARQGIRLQLADLFGFESTQQDALRKIARAQTEAVLSTPRFESETAQGIYSGGASLIRQVPGLAASILTRSAAPSLAAAGVQTEAEAYGKYRERGATPGQAALGGVGEGLTEVATEFLPMGFLVNRFGKAGAGEFLAGLLAREIPSEQVATVVQDAIDTAIANPDKTWTQYLEERPGAAYQTLLATLVQSGAMGGASAVANRLQARASKAQAAETDAQALQSISEAAAQSKLRGRDPEAFKRLLEDAVEDGPVQDVYVNAETLVNVLEQSNITLEEIGQTLPSVAEQLAQALDSNGDVRIPVAEYFSGMAGTEADKAILPHLRTEPDAMSQAEASTFMQSQAEEIRKEAERIISQQAEESAFADSAKQVEDDFMQQLQSTGRFDDKVNKAYASLLRDFYVVNAQRLGITPAEMAARYPLKIASELVEADQQFDQAAGQNVGTPAFRDWFGESKVVDETGAPLLVYHGTRPGNNITAFETPNATDGVYFTPDPSYAQAFTEELFGDSGARGAMYPAYLSVKNPYIVRVEDIASDEAQNFLNRGLNRAELQAQGYDGAMLYVGKELDQVIVFDPAQIKSQFNRGTFDATDADILNQGPLLGEGEVKRVLRREPGEFTPEEQAAFDEFMSTRPDAERIMRNLAEHKGTPWAKQAVEGIFTRQAMRMLINGQEPNFQSSMDSKQVGRTRRVLKERGLDGLWSLIELDGGLMGHAAKPVNNVNSSFINCDPSKDCAKYCYATNGNYQYANVIVKSEMVTLAVEMDPVRSAQRVASEYKATAEYANNKALRLFDKGDGDMAWIPFIEELNKQNIRVQIFSKGPEFLRAVPNVNLRLLSIDDSNMDMADQNPDLPVAFVYSGMAQAEFLAKLVERGQIQVVLPIKLGQKLLDGSEIKDLRKEVKGVSPYLCPIDSGFKKLGGNQDVGAWNCTKCDKNGGVGCFHGTPTKGMMTSAESKPVSNREKAQRILELKGRINEITAATASGLADAGRVPPGGVEGLLREVDALLGDLLKDYEPAGQGSTAFQLGSGTVTPVGGYEGGVSGGGAGNQPAGRRVIPIRTLNQSAANGTPTDAADSASGAAGGINTLGQSDTDGARGQIAMAQDITLQPSVITLLKNADLSTFLHESGHFFLEVYADIAARPDAPEAIVRDMNAVMSWFGITDSPELSAVEQWRMMTLNEKRDYHESFARGFEAYLFEGKSPNPDMQSAFSRFRSWLLSVYKRVLELTKNDVNKAMNVQLNDEVRAVFDRMLATEDQIKLAELNRNMQPLFSEQPGSGMTLDEWEQYQELGKAATDEAIRQMELKSMRDMRWATNAKNKTIRKLQKQAKAIRAQVRMDVRREVMNEPLYRAWAFLTGENTVQVPKEIKSRPDEIDPTIDSLFVAIAKAGGLNKEQLLSEWGPDPADLKQVNTGLFGKPLYRVEGGVSLDRMLETLNQYGYFEQDEYNRADMRQFEEMFMEELRGYPQYSMFMDPSRAMFEAPEPDVDLETLPGGKLDLAAVKAFKYRADVNWKRLVNLRMTSAQDGLYPDFVANLFGFSSGDELVQSLVDAKTPDEVIEERTDKRMLEQYGELSTPQAIERVAEQAVHNEVRARFVATELKAVAAAMSPRRPTGRGRGSVNALADAAKIYAEEIMARKKLREIKPNQFSAAEARAARSAMELQKAGNTQGVIEAKRAQLINNYAARAATKALDEIDRANRYLRKFANETTRKAIDPDYRDQIDQLLESVDLKSMSGRDMDRRASLAQWVESQRELGFEPAIDDRLLAEMQRKPFREMTLEEMRGLVDTIKNIEHLGRMKKRLLTAAENRDLALRASAIAESIYANTDKRIPVKLENNTWWDKAKQGASEFFAMHRKLASIVRQMDGNKDGGVFWDTFIRPMNERGDLESSMREKATIELSALFDPIIKAGGMREKMFIPAIGTSLSKEGRLSVALNWGNDTNRKRVMDGEGWSADQVESILDTLTAEDWKFVQGVWDYIDSYWPQIAAKERRVSGVEPGKVDPAAVQTKFGELRGGYYPIKYDSNRSSKADADNLAEVLKQAMQGLYTRATTRRGHTKARVDVVKRPVRKDFGVLFEHVDQVIHDLAWHEWLIDASRLLRNGAVDSAIRETYGPEILRVMSRAVDDIAKGDIPAANTFERSINYLRSGATIAGLGWNLGTALLQPLGLTQSIVRIGPKWVGRGISRWMQNAVTMEDGVQWIYDRSEFMRLRGKTMQREINEIRNKVSSGKGKVLNAVEDSYFWMIQRGQLLVDVPTWLGAYEKAMHENADDESRAIALADQAVLDSQGGGQIKDLAQIQRGGPLMKLWTNFYSFFNTTYNLTAERVSATDFKKPGEVGRLAVDFFILYSVPAVLGVLMKAAVRGDDEDDELAEKLAREQLNYLLGTMVGLRELGAAFNAFGDYTGPGGTRFFSEFTKLGKQVQQGEVDAAALKALNNTAGILLHYPSGQVQRTAEGMAAIIEGKTDSPAALLMGAPK